MTVLTIALNALQNKHTTGAAGVYALAKWGCPLLATWWPSHKAQIDASANILEGAAVFYGFAAAGDAGRSATKQEVKQVADAVRTGDTSMLERSVPSRENQVVAPDAKAP